MTTTVAHLSRFGTQLETLELALGTRSLGDVRATLPQVEDAFGKGIAPLPKNASQVDESCTDPNGQHVKLVGMWQQTVRINTRSILTKQAEQFLRYLNSRSDRVLAQRFYATVYASGASPDLIAFAVNQNLFPQQAMRHLKRTLCRTFAHTFDSGSFPAIAVERGALWAAETDSVEADPHDDVLFLADWANAGSNDALWEKGNGYTHVEQWHVSNTAPQQFEELLGEIYKLSFSRPVLAVAYHLAMRNRSILEEYLARSPLIEQTALLNMIVEEAVCWINGIGKKGRFSGFVAMLRECREAELAKSPRDMI